MTKSSRRVRPKPRVTGSSSQRWKAWIPVALVAGIAALIIYAVYAFYSTSDDVGIAGVQFLGSPAQGHEQGVIAYETTPPIGGIHNPVWQNCGVYAQPVGNENAVHSMEHGAVWITYSPDMEAAAVEQLRNVARGRSHVLLSPFEGLPSPVVASAWGIQLQLDSADDSRLPRFISRYEQGEQTPEPGATCRGGIGDPIG